MLFHRSRSAPSLWPKAKGRVGEGCRSRSAAIRLRNQGPKLPPPSLPLGCAKGEERSSALPPQQICSLPLAEGQGEGLGRGAVCGQPRSGCKTRTRSYTSDLPLGCAKGEERSGALPSQQICPLPLAEGQGEGCRSRSASIKRQSQGPKLPLPASPLASPKWRSEAAFPSAQQRGGPSINQTAPGSPPNPPSHAPACARRRPPDPRHRAGSRPPGSHRRTGSA